MLHSISCKLLSVSSKIFRTNTIKFCMLVTVENFPQKSSCKTTVSAFADHRPSRHPSEYSVQFDPLKMFTSASCFKTTMSTPTLHRRGTRPRRPPPPPDADISFAQHARIVHDEHSDVAEEEEPSNRSDQENEQPPASPQERNARPSRQRRRYEFELPSGTSKSTFQLLQIISNTIRRL